MNTRFLSLVFLVLFLVSIALSAKPRRARKRKTNIPSKATKPNPKAKKLDPDQFLEKFGYLPHPGRGKQIQHTINARRQAVKIFQKMVGLKVTGRMDPTTLWKMNQPRCGLPDVTAVDKDRQSEPSGDPRGPQSFYAPGYKWKKKDLSWKASRYSSQLSQGSQRRAFYNAFKYWNEVSQLNFREISSGEADIEIKFAAGEHGDGYGNAFDGEGGILAHAFFPENGDTHFDEQERWTEYVNEGTNLQIVAAHEFGHALGLGHSNVPNALMAPFYQGYDANFQLHSDDIEGIQRLYGARARPRPTPSTTRKPSHPATTKKPSTDGKPDTCTTKFDAVFKNGQGRYFVFKDKWMWRLTENGVEKGYPRLSRKYFRKAPSRMGAAVYSWQTGYTYFFKGSRIWKYQDKKLLGKKTIENTRYPKSPQAAMMGRDGRIYIFKGGSFWAFDERRMDVIDTRGRLIRNTWAGIPSKIHAAVRTNDGYIYFFKGDKYWKYSEYYRRVMPGYPKKKAGPWMGKTCSNGKRLPK